MVVSINKENQRSNILIFLRQGSRDGGEVFIISASVNLQNPAKGFYAALEPKLITASNRCVSVA
ncbi:hypothetical protein [Ructibacterium gallinarum]|uniref:hypothetical protein n=1 Tax=Ructibacterium gallinarum TaxID=2779355 RepID=UPI001CF8561D|nr:hypothetical protein [Ructibacterium gallinarum]